MSTTPGGPPRDYPQFIPNAGVCLATRNVLDGTGKVRWMLRNASAGPADNGWRIMSHVDTSEYLNDQSNWVVTDFNQVCAIEPALIGIYDLAVGSDLQMVVDERGRRVVDTPSGREIPRENLYVPPQHRAQAEPSTGSPDAAGGQGGDADGGRGGKKWWRRR